MSRLGPSLALSCALALLAAAPANASFHTMVVNEVMLSTGGNANAQFVELVDISDEPFPDDFAPYKLVVFDGAGVKVGAHPITTATLQGRDNTVPFLISTAAADGALGSAGDEVLNVALPSPGQACFTNGAGESKVSCVAWGCVATPVSGAINLPAPADGKSLQRQGSTTSSTFHHADPTPKTANGAGAAAGSCAAPPPPDSDGDGVPDSSDACPNQFAQTANGCPPAPPADSDGDGVPNTSDACPDQPAQTANGCPAATNQPDPTATAGNDTITGDALANVICGLAGDDTIAGGQGDDTIWGDRCDVAGGAAGGDDRLDGNDGNDALHGAGGDDRLRGGRGKDALDGGRGDDRLIGGPGKNSYVGGAGADTVNARNGTRETVDCGRGRGDSASVDRNDRVRNCEKVIRPRR